MKSYHRPTFLEINTTIEAPYNILTYTIYHTDIVLSYNIPTFIEINAII